MPYDAPLFSSVKKLKAKAVDGSGRSADKPVKFSIIKQSSNLRPAIDIFQIEEDSGVILLGKVCLFWRFSVFNTTYVLFNI